MEKTLREFVELTRPTSVLCENIKKFDREIQNGGCLKIADFEIFVQNFNIAYKKKLSKLSQNAQQQKAKELIKYVFE